MCAAQTARLVRQFDRRVSDCRPRMVDMEASHMTMESHLAELERRHQALERELEEAIAHPGTDGLALTELKRRKLQLKDEIVRLRSDSLH